MHNCFDLRFLGFIYQIVGFIIISFSAVVKLFYRTAENVLAGFSIHAVRPSRIYFSWVIFMVKKKQESAPKADDLRVSPELRLCPKFDSTSIANFPVASRDQMGMRVLDNCAEEHIM